MNQSYLTSSRGAKLSTNATPASLRKELRHLSKELSSSDFSNAVSSRKVKPGTKGAEKENFRLSNHSASASSNEWMRGGGAVSPAVFSFSDASPPSRSQALLATSFAAISTSAAPAEASLEIDRINLPQTLPATVWIPGAAIPRGLMVSSCACLS
jgi:hypothetical protein